jgi:hypothetical protein
MRRINGTQIFRLYEDKDGRRRHVALQSSSAIVLNNPIDLLCGHLLDINIIILSYLMGS